MRRRLAAASFSALLLAACSSSQGPGSSGTGGGGVGGGASTSSQGGGGVGGATASTSSQGGGGAATTSTSSGADPLETAREACVAKINSLRATKQLSPYDRWNDAEMCVDQQATADEMSMSPHGAWKSMTYSCNGSAQNECLGAGVGGIEGCLDQMWAEKDQPGCAGCDACAGGYDPNCPNCDFYGMKTGNVCGHYVNMSAKYHSKAACGFSSLGGWDAINFQ